MNAAMSHSGTKQTLLAGLPMSANDAVDGAPLYGIDVPKGGCARSEPL
jgi:hypothetical protein